MIINEYLRAIAGTAVVVSVAARHWIHPGFYVLTALVGLNLLQSAFTRWCPAIALLRALGVRE